MPHFCLKGVRTVNETKTSFAEKIGGTTFVVNAFQSENAKLTQEELVKRIIAEKSRVLAPDAA
jgi:hypothetical protein